MIIPLEDFPKLREEKLKGKKIVATSGFFDPIHPGHISCIRESKKFGDVLVVIVNGDKQCVTKKGKAFLPADVRAYIVDNLKDVDYVVIYDHPTKYDSSEPLKIVRPNVFTKGGDRVHPPTGPLAIEVAALEEIGATIEYNVGDPKIWSSSNYLQEWVDFVNSQKKD
jgi:cytidyltransferase-like protein